MSETKGLDEYNFLDPALQKCPYDFYRRLRAEAPVYREPRTGFWIVSRYRDLQAVIKDTVTFSNDLVLFDKVSARKPTAADALLKAQAYPRPQTLQRTDPPRHQRYRKLIDRAFTASRVRDMTPYIDGVVRDLIDGFSSEAEIDFVARFAMPLPCIVIADQIGVPRADIPRLKAWSDALLEPAGMMTTPERELECARLTIEFQRYFAEKIEERRVSPREDILTALVGEMSDSEDPLSTAEALNLLEQILTGGNETTTSTIAGAMLLLIQHPEEEARLRRNPDLLRNFTEECLRLETPVQGLFRQTTRDVEVCGVTIPKDQIVIIRHGAANRDEERFEEADRFDVCRANAGAHLAFGAGVHFCPGAMLARQEIASAYRQLFERFAGFALVPERNTFDYNPSFFLRGLKALWIRPLARQNGVV
ncbi:MAG: cytochrome P450 [Caulobacterales bacterium]|jgi:cytochrome P450